MSPASFRLKQTTGWFAAGREVHQAMRSLSDAAFKLFLWLCLHAERSTGSVCWQPEEVAGELGKNLTEIQASLEELIAKGIARLASHGTIEILDRFWPYQRAQRLSGADRGDYISEVKQLLLQRACVRSVFTSADETLATQLHQKGVSLQCIERAIGLGCLRKYAALLNHRGSAPVTSLHYFTALFEEVERAEVSDDYWRYVASKLRTLEQQMAATPGRSANEPASLRRRNDGDEIMVLAHPQMQIRSPPLDRCE